MFYANFTSVLGFPTLETWWATLLHLFRVSPFSFRCQGAYGLIARKIYALARVLSHTLDKDGGLRTSCAPKLPLKTHHHPYQACYTKAV